MLVSQGRIQFTVTFKPLIEPVTFARCARAWPSPRGQKRDIYTYIHTYIHTTSEPAIRDYLPRAKALGNHVRVALPMIVGAWSMIMVVVLYMAAY